MSQRLHIGPTKDSYYDCVIDRDEFYIKEKINSRWLVKGNGFFLGPWKISIGNKKKFLQIQPLIEEVFQDVGKKYPDCIWVFYEGDRSIEHPTKEELSEWIND